ncbi:MAG: tetratricopeptide repeat protein [Erythrobacter sp.]|uniref:tetratricopeptide repeat protein n=1 Tax=Erythrobacter sp. TaxID=1042 RepID=UPI0025FB3865|nr:tetratricopeptide repeat protein [Erythrobacter sp.]MCM0000236.1 tetratricopeptide repeat protein [Erythrobacter sp.]
MAGAETAIAEHRYFDARAALLAWREDNGASPENSALLAEVLVELGDGYTAERYLTELEPQRGTTPEWLSLRVRSLILQGKPWRARELIEQSDWKGSPEGERDYLLVWAAMEEGNAGQAIADVDRALRLYPDHPGLNAKAARLAVWEGNWEAANLHVAAALAAEPDQFEALLVQGEGQIALGDLEEALKTYRRAGAAYPDFAISHANVAGLLLDLGRLDEADKVLGKALQAHPEFSLLRFNAARLAALRGQWQVARTTVQALPSDWKRTFPATTMLEADIEAGLGNHAMANTLYSQLEDDPRFSAQALAKRGKLPLG